MSRSILIPLLILVGLLIIYLLVRSGERQEITPDVTDNFLGIDSGYVNQIVLKKLGSEIRFEKRSDTWFVDDDGRLREAADQAVSGLVDLSYDLSVGEIVSSNPEKRILFQVDSLTGTRLEFYREDTYLAGVIVGKMGPDYSSTYMRKPESNDVYLAEGSYAQLFNRPPSAFMDKTLLELEPGQIRTIEYTGRETNYTIQWLDTAWTVVPHSDESFTANDAKVERTVRRFSNLTFSEFVDEPAALQIDFNNPELQVVISLADGSEASLALVPEGGESKNYYVKSSADPEPYIVYDYIVNSMAPKLDELRASEAG
jgi:hypothetical protein